MSKLAGVAVIGLVALPSAVGRAATSSSCHATLTHAKLGSVVVAAGQACTVKQSTITGSVTVMKGGYFEADATQIHGSVTGLGAQTIFINTGSHLGGSVIGKGTRQVFVYNSTIGKAISARGFSSSAQICGTTLKHGDLTVNGGHREVLVGDPAAHCGANTLDAGSLTVKSNRTADFFAVISNWVKKGDMTVSQNTGGSKKLVKNNRGGGRLACSNNAKPFTGKPNGKWKSKTGQCK
jgi:hypothetical protein